MYTCNEPMGGQNLQNVQLQHAGQHSSSVCMFSRKHSHRDISRLSLNIHPVNRSILFQEEGVATVTELHKKSDLGAASRLKMVLKDLHMDARF